MPYSVEADTLDKYEGFHYYVCAVSDLGSHKQPYVAIDQNDDRVAWIDLENRKVEFYPHTPNEVIKDKGKMQRWLDKENNYVGAVRRWNKLNPKYPMS